MKKNKLFLFIACCVMFSCKKDHAPVVELSGKTYKVTYKINADAALQTSALSKTRVNGVKTNTVIADTSIVKKLYYIVFDSGNNVVRYLQQDSTSSNFGTITDSLASGTYTICIAAGQNGLSTDANTNVNDENHYEHIDYYYLYFPSGWNKDTFLDKFQLTVANSPVDQDVTLKRIVGQLQINFTDEIPADAKYITVTIKNDHAAYLLLDNLKDYDDEDLDFSSKTATYTTNIPANAIGHTGFKINNFIGNTTTSFQVIITCYNSTNKVLSSVVVSNVTCQENKRTLLTGKLMGSSNNFGVTLNNDWDITPVTVHF